VNDDRLQDAELRELAQRLGMEAAARLDVEQVAQAVVRRLREQPRLARWTRRAPVWVALAAGLVLLLGAGVALQSVRRHAESRATAAVAPAGLDLSELTADQLRDVLRTLDRPFDGASAGSVDAGLDDLTTPELRKVLRSLEG
jgi:hypothetical protein